MNISSPCSGGNAFRSRVGFALKADCSPFSVRFRGDWRAPLSCLKSRTQVQNVSEVCKRRFKIKDNKTQKGVNRSVTL